MTKRTKRPADARPSAPVLTIQPSGHYCPDWDEMWVDDGSDEASICICRHNAKAAAHKCCGCLKMIDWPTYDRNDYLCDDCLANVDRYPLQTTHGGIAP